MREAPDNGRKALQILRKGKTKIISFYTELTSLWKANGKSITDYIIRGENAATLLKTLDVLTDSLLIAMVLKVFLSKFKLFITVITQKDKIVAVSECKRALQSSREK